MIRVASDQPSLLPWAGFWHKAMAVDLLIYSVGVPVSHGAGDHYHNRVRLQGSWLTLPVTKATRSGLWKDLRIDRCGLAKAARTIRNCFGKKHPHAEFPHHIADLVERYPDDRLVPLNEKLIARIARRLRLGFTAVEDLVIPDQSQSKTERLVARIRRHTSEPVEYYMGRGALQYIDPGVLAANDIRLMLQTWDTVPKDQTVLQLIAQDDDPAGLIRSMGHWETFA